MRRQLSVFAAVFLAAGATALISPASHADETAADTPLEEIDVQLEEIDTGRKPATTELEEITVFGQMSTSRLGIRFKKAQLEFLDLYNSLNTKDEFRVVCEKKAMSGSNFKKTSCEPVYYKEAASEAFQNSVAAQSVGRNGMRMDGPPPSAANIELLTRKKKQEAIQHMISLVESNPELLRKYNELVKSQLAFERSRAPESSP